MNNSDIKQKGMEYRLIINVEYENESYRKIGSFLSTAVNLTDTTLVITKVHYKKYSGFV